jgi:hypothetical protein
MMTGSFRMLSWRFQYSIFEKKDTSLFPLIVYSTQNEKLSRAIVYSGYFIIKYFKIQARM